MSHWILYIILPGILAGCVQGMSGFGMGIVIMLVLPLFFTVGQSAAISQTASLFLCIFIAWKYRKYTQWKVCYLPWLFYFPILFVAMPIAAKFDTVYLKPALGVFLVALSIYCIIFSEKIHLKANWKSALACAGTSALIDAFFGLGGPPMVLYFLAVTNSNEAYLGTIQTMFTLTCLVNIILRIINGQMTTQMIPTLCVIVPSLLVGVLIGGHFVKKIDQKIMKRIIYGVVGIAGVITILTNL
jgi:hypothetical protein